MVSVLILAHMHKIFYGSLIHDSIFVIVYTVCSGQYTHFSNRHATCLLHIQKLALKTFNYYAGNVPAFNEPRIKKRRTHEMSTSALEFRDLGTS